MRKRRPAAVIASGAGSIAVGGAATNCQFVTNVHAPAATEPISSARLIRLPFLPLKEKFAGREDFLRNLSDLLAQASAKTTSPPIAIYADGGIGKSTLAIELGWRLYESKRFNYVFFLNATTPNTLDNSVAELCDPVVQSEGESSPAQLSMRREAVLRWLQIPKRAARTLIIFDGADSQRSAEAVRSFLPKLPYCAKLITSRNAVWDDAVALELPVFTAVESRAFLRSCLSPKGVNSPASDVALDEVATAVDHLPLALEIVSSYIRKKRLSIADWLKEWNQNPAAVVSHEDPARIRYKRELEGYPTSLAYVWKQSIEDLSEAARKYLNLLTLMIAPRPAVFPLSKVRLQWSGTTEAVSELSEASLVSWHTDHDDLSMHRVMQLVTRMHQADSEKSSSLFVAALILNSILPQPEWNEAGWRVWEQLAPHIESLLGHLENDTAEFVRGLGVGILNQYGLWLTNRAEYEKAELLFRKAMSVAEKATGAETAEMGACINNLAKVLHDRSRLSEAEPLYRRALAVTENALGADHPEVAIRLGNLGALLLNTQRPREAEPLFQRALKIDQKNFGMEDLRVARDLNNLAAAMRFTDQLDEAESLLRRALVINEGSLPPGHPDLATSINNLGELLMTRGQLKEASDLFRKALGIIQNSLGVAHPLYATALHNVATTLESFGKSEEAERLLREGIAISEKSLGADHLNVARDLVLLSELLERRGDFAEAGRLAQRALSIDERILGDSHPTVARDLNAVAMVLSKTGQLDTAMSLLRRALAVDETNFGPAHPDTAVTLFNLASVLSEADDESAEGYYRRALSIFETDPARHRTNLGNCLEAFGEFLTAHKRFDDAEPFLRRALALSQTGPLISPTEIARRSNNLGDVLWSAGRVVEGQPFILEGLLILHRLGLLSGKQHPSFEGLLTNYFGALRAGGMPEQEAVNKVESVLMADADRLVKHLTTVKE